MSAKFFKAIKAGDKDKVERMLRKDPNLIRAKDKGNLSPLMVALYYHENELADLFQERMLAFSIFEAAATGKMAHVISNLARNPELVNAFSEDGFQPLGLAAYFAHEEVAEYLVRAGAEVNSPSRNALAVTPLQSAVAGGNARITSLLLGHGANPNVRERGGYTPLHVAAHNGSVDIVRKLIFNGADIEARNEEGELPLDMALKAGHNEAAELLKEGITRRFRSSRIKD